MIGTLTDGGQTPLEIARLLASFVERARADARPRALRRQPRGRDGGARARHARARPPRAASRVRLLYNVDRRPPGSRSPPPPKTRPEEIEALPFAKRGVPGWPDLMHHKYVVRDGDVGLDRLDELDRRLVVARGERDRRRRLRRESRRATPRTSSSCGGRSACRRSGKVSSTPLPTASASWFCPKRG